MRNAFYALLTVVILLAVAACHAAVSGIPLAANTGGPGSSVLLINITQPQNESVVRSNPIAVSGNISGGTEVMINGLQAETEGGHFRAVVQLETGSNSIEITVGDGTGKRVSKYVSVVYVP